eukprot:c7196_g1_i1.p1 GENE.c7196_g1_i1~~c7196_g1_i1.p1  ORF type:complete len:825 (+),score=118.20 c7196_g1_i1:59-2533(+)
MGCFGKKKKKNNSDSKTTLDLHDISAKVAVQPRVELALSNRSGAFKPPKSSVKDQGRQSFTGRVSLLKTTSSSSMANHSPKSKRSDRKSQPDVSRLTPNDEHAILSSTPVLDSRVPTFAMTRQPNGSEPPSEDDTTPVPPDVTTDSRTPISNAEVTPPPPPAEGEVVQPVLERKFSRTSVSVLGPSKPVQATEAFLASLRRVSTDRGSGALERNDTEPTPQSQIAATALRRTSTDRGSMSFERQEDFQSSFPLATLDKRLSLLRSSSARSMEDFELVPNLRRASHVQLEQAVHIPKPVPGESKTSFGTVDDPDEAPTNEFEDSPILEEPPAAPAEIMSDEIDDQPPLPGEFTPQSSSEPLPIDNSNLDRFAPLVPMRSEYDDDSEHKSENITDSTNVGKEQVVQIDPVNESPRLEDAAEDVKPAPAEREAHVEASGVVLHFNDGEQMEEEAVVDAVQVGLDVNSIAPPVENRLKRKGSHIELGDHVGAKEVDESLSEGSAAEIENGEGDAGDNDDIDDVEDNIEEEVQVDGGDAEEASNMSRGSSSSSVTEEGDEEDDGEAEEVEGTNEQLEEEADELSANDEQTDEVQVDQLQADESEAKESQSDELESEPSQADDEVNAEEPLQQDQDPVTGGVADSQDEPQGTPTDQLTEVIEMVVHATGETEASEELGSVERGESIIISSDAPPASPEVALQTLGSLGSVTSDFSRMPTTAEEGNEQIQSLQAQIRLLQAQLKVQAAVAALDAPVRPYRTNTAPNMAGAQPLPSLPFALPPHRLENHPDCLPVRFKVLRMWIHPCQSGHLLSLTTLHQYRSPRQSHRHLR